jgi:hypothetical protein
LAWIWGRGILGVCYFENEKSKRPHLFNQICSTRQICFPRPHVPMYPCIPLLPMYPHLPIPPFLHPPTLLPPHSRGLGNQEGLRALGNQGGLPEGRGTTGHRRHGGRLRREQAESVGVTPPPHHPTTPPPHNPTTNPTTPPPHHPLTPPPPDHPTTPLHHPETGETKAMLLSTHVRFPMFSPTMRGRLGCSQREGSESK